VLTLPCSYASHPSRFVNKASKRVVFGLFVHTLGKGVMSESEVAFPEENETSSVRSFSPEVDTFSSSSQVSAPAVRLPMEAPRRL
jgi:hypothetical protein